MIIRSVQLFRYLKTLGYNPYEVIGKQIKYEEYRLMIHSLAYILQRKYFFYFGRCYIAYNGLYCEKISRKLHNILSEPEKFEGIKDSTYKGIAKITHLKMILNNFPKIYRSKLIIVYALWLILRENKPLLANSIFLEYLKRVYPKIYRYFVKNNIEISSKLDLIDGYIEEIQEVLA